uniref:Uncharacterized protein n=1 Tax=Oryza meridionalis TaxID=40149 RepID=A0A0E0CEA1_9ORYZ
MNWAHDSMSQSDLGPVKNTGGHPERRKSAKPNRRRRLPPPSLRSRFPPLLQLLGLVAVLAARGALHLRRLPSSRAPGDAMDEESQPKSPSLERPAAATDANSGGGYRARHCRHVLYGEDDINLAIELIKTCDDTPMCNADNCDNTEGREISVCLDCESRFCTTHGKWHASINKHWVALVYKKPHVTYCFACEECYFIRTENFGEVTDVDEDDYIISYHEDEKGMIVDNVAGDHASGSVIGHACPIKVIPNLGNTCYLNSLMQCLLILEFIQQCLVLPPFHIIGLSSIVHIHTYVNESRYICVSRFIKIYMNVGNARKSYNLKRRE